MAGILCRTIRLVLCSVLLRACVTRASASAGIMGGEQKWTDDQDYDKRPTGHNKTTLSGDLRFAICDLVLNKTVVSPSLQAQPHTHTRTRGPSCEYFLLLSRT